MINFTEETKNSIKSHLIMFWDTMNFEENKGKPVGQIADIYIKNEMDMQQGMKDYYNYLREEGEKNTAFLNDIKKEKGKTFYKYLMEIIEESEGIKGLAEIVDKPIGKFQKEKFGRQIKGIWVEQWSVGMEGDSYEGFVCVELSKDRYLKFGYSM